MKKKFFYRKAPVSLSVECCEFLQFLAVKSFFTAFTGSDFLRKRNWLHGFEPLASWLSAISYSIALFVTYFSDIFCEFKITVEISVVKICMICYFSGENFFYRVLLVAVKHFFTTFCWRWWKSFFQCLSGEKKSHHLRFFSPHSLHWTQILYFFSNFPKFTSFSDF